MKNKSRFNRGYCKIKKHIYNLSIVEGLAKRAVETNIQPPSETTEIETNKYFVVIDFYDERFFCNTIREIMEEKYGKKEPPVVPYNFLQFREKSGKEWHPLVFSDAEAICVADFLLDKTFECRPIKWEKNETNDIGRSNRKSLRVC